MLQCRDCGDSFLKTDLHVFCLSFQGELQLADDGVFLSQGSVQIIFNILLGSLQVFQRVCEMLQFHILLFDDTIKTLQGLKPVQS